MNKVDKKYGFAEEYIKKGIGKGAISSTFKELEPVLEENRKGQSVIDNSMNLLNTGVMNQVNINSFDNVISSVLYSKSSRIAKIIPR